MSKVYDPQRAASLKAEIAYLTKLTKSMWGTLNRNRHKMDSNAYYNQEQVILAKEAELKERKRELEFLGQVTLFG